MEIREHILKVVVVVIRKETYEIILYYSNSVFQLEGLHPSLYKEMRGFQGRSWGQWQKSVQPAVTIF